MDDGREKFHLVHPQCLRRIEDSILLKNAILDMVETIQTNVDKALLSCGVFIDLKKKLLTL